MNKYGEIAKSHWAMTDPAEEAVLADLVWIPQPGEETEEPATDWVTQTMRAIHDADPDNEPPQD